MLLTLDIDYGSAIVADPNGNTRRYHRTGECQGRSHFCHAIWNESEGRAERTRLLEVYPFPDELFIQHRAPAGTPRRTARERVFRYEPIPAAAAGERLNTG